MNKKIRNISITLVIIFWVTGVLSSDVLTNQGYIKRLTHSGNNSVHYPWLSDDGQWMLYVLENDTGEEINRSIRLMDVDAGKDTELFQDKKVAAPEPYKDVSLLVGTKPPMLSGNGKVAVFVLSLDKPENILDHFIAIINTDGTGLKILSFPIESLQGKDWKALDFQAKEWERISHYAVNSDGSRVACVMKGHLGPIRYGNASAIILIDTHSGEQNTILDPELNEDQWEWTGFPSRPLMGGGWAFCMNGTGDKFLFGAQSSDDQLDYDIYLSDWEGNKIKKITDFQDRWFSLAEMSRDGEKIALFYTGKKKQGIGTYLLRSDATELEFAKSRFSPRIEFFDLSGNGKYILFKHIYDGVLLDIETGEEGIAFDKNTQGYVSGLIPMDFPRFPAFWGPHIMSHDGRRVLLAGMPEGKKNPEFYLLNFEMKE